MSDPVSDVNETVCCQCGVPADPDCAYTAVLYAPASREVVSVRVPRCKACRNRTHIWAFLICGGFVAGCMAGLMLPWRLITVVAPLIVIIAIGLAIRRYERLSGRRFTHDYPPIRRLLEAGWRFPNN